MTRESAKSTNHNIGTPERWVSVFAGTALTAYGIGRRSLAGAGIALAGGALLQRGLSGHCAVKSAVEGSGPMRLERTFTIPNKSPEEVYEFWRNLENLPGLIDGLESVKVLGERRSHWVARGAPGTRIKWDAEITNERRGYLIEWKTLPGSDLELSGSVRFKRKQAGGTKVHLSLRYTTPGGAIGEALGRLLHVQPPERLDAGIENLRQALQHT
jgi:uncharacterized membrane protein